MHIKITVFKTDSTESILKSVIREMDSGFNPVNASLVLPLVLQKRNKQRNKTERSFSEHSPDEGFRVREDEKRKGSFTFTKETPYSSTTYRIFVKKNRIITETNELVGLLAWELAKHHIGFNPEYKDYNMTKKEVK